MHVDSESLFRASFTTLFLLIVLTQAYYGRKNRRQDRVFALKKDDARREGRFKMVLQVTNFILLATVAGFYAADATWMRPLLAPFPGWLRWLGVGFGTLGIAGLIAVHQALGKYWSPYLRIQEDHRLVTDGPYRWVRHPMYSALIGLMIALGLISANWLLILLCGMRIALLYMRISKEEAMMISRFGDQYRDYMQRTGRLVPRLAR
jgi:protein-S-isoprenylcysteine O-methyltransferase Ste14